MTRPIKPSINVNPPANRCTMPHERIVEFTTRQGGGLLQIRYGDDGTVTLVVYRQDPTVHVVVCQDSARSVTVAPDGTVTRRGHHE